MLQNVSHVVIKGSNTMFLNIPEGDYFSMYDSLTKESAEDIAQRYFMIKGKEATPHIREMEIDSETHKVKLMIKVHNNFNHQGTVL